MVRLLFFIALMHAAVPVLAQGVLVSAQTGLVGGYSAELQVSRHRHFSVYAQGTVIRRANDVFYGVVLRHGLNEGSILYIDEAWSRGAQLRFEGLPPDQVCGGSRCLYNIGVLSFNATEFTRFAQSGMEIRLIGSEGPIDITIPARVFAEASTEAAAILN